MGLYGAVIVLPNNIRCAPAPLAWLLANLQAEGALARPISGLRQPPTTIAKTCYDREYLFQFSEMDPNIHIQALAQVTPAGLCTPALRLQSQCPHRALSSRLLHDQRPLDARRHGPQLRATRIRISPTTAIRTCIRASRCLVRVIGQGRWQHPFHEHGNHVRILARDGNLILSQTDPSSSCRTAAVHDHHDAGLALDGIFYWTGKGLNWDMYGHNPGSGDATATASLYSRRQRLQHGGAPPPSTITSGARTTTSRCRLLPSAMSRRAVRRLCPIPTSSPTVPGIGGSPYLGPDATCARSERLELLRPRHYCATHPPVRLALLSCGTRTTSARSPPTIFSPAE